MNVSACLVTRGDHDITPITDSLTASGIDDIVVWDNAEREDLAVYGRYAAIAEAKHDLIYVQDDDCVVSDPQVIVDTWLRGANRSAEASPKAQVGAAATWPEHVHPRGSDVLVANMPAAFRHDFYSDHCLVGFGAVFHRDLPQRAFERLNVGMTWKGVCPPHWSGLVLFDTLNFRRTCDIVFTALTPRVLVDVPYENLPWATDESRMYRQNGHVGERTRMLELVRAVRDAG